MSNHNFWIIFLTAILFITGCVDKTPTVTKKPVQKKTTVDIPQKVHKKIALKEVEDNNYSSEYMYPEDKVKKEKVVKVAEAETIAATITTASGMSKTECISMIGQIKFDKYTQMFGNEASSIKRCAMLKAMN